jgi:hypothetical protein
MPRVAVIGPNLYDQTKGSFHVHAEDCGDIKHYGRHRKFGGDYDPKYDNIDAETYADVAIYVYDNGILDEMQYDGTTFEEAVNECLTDFWFAPCVKGLK